MTESSPLLSSGTWFSPYNSDDAKSIGSGNDVAGGVVSEVIVNTSYDDSSSDYHDYSIRVERDARARVKRLETGVYRVRWYLLFLLSMTVATQNAVWSTWGPIAESAKVRMRQQENSLTCTRLQKSEHFHKIVICSRCLGS